jgi:Putative adhesin
VVAKVAEGSRMTSPWNIRTIDGSVDVLLPRDFRANINASTRDGHIKLALPVTVQGEISQSKVEGTLNGGGPELLLKSTDGAIRLGSL